MKLAIVHDYLNQRGGAERVVEVFHQMFAEAPIYTLMYESNNLLDGLKDAQIIPTFLQRVKFVRKRFKLFFWFYPFAIRTLKIEGFDVVLSSSSAYGKGIKLKHHRGRRTTHVCYCHTPMRFAWSFNNYIRNETANSLLRNVARCLVPFLKWWDLRTAKDVDYFIANSSIVAQRIKDFYNREATVIYPPVDVPEYLSIHEPENYFLVVSRLVSYKRIDLAIQACTRANLPLIVIGEGPDRFRLESMAGSSITFLGYQDENVKKYYMSRCKAFIFPGEEDFGITPLEVNGFGRPVVAFKGGGALDTVIEGLNGLFFTQPTVESLAVALGKVSQCCWDPREIHEWASQFNRREFVSKLTATLKNWSKENGELLPGADGGRLRNEESMKSATTISGTSLNRQLD